MFVLRQNGMYAGTLISYEYRNFRLGGGPAIVGHDWQWSDGRTNGERSAGRALRPGMVWEASAALWAGTRWSPEFRIQQRSFLDVEIDGFGPMPAFPMRHHTFSVGLGTTARWWGGQ